VIEAGRAEVVPEVLAQPLVLTEDDARGHRFPLTVDPWCHRARNRRPDTIREPA